MNERKRPWLKITREKKNIAAILGLAAVFLISLGAYAAYTNQAFLRGVLRNNYNETARFSSNYLQLCEKGTVEKNYVSRVVLFPDDSKDNIAREIDIYLYNYANGNSKKVNEKDITYDMVLKLTGGNAQKVEFFDENNKVTELNATDGVYQTQETLIGRTPKVHRYRVTILNSDLNHIHISAKAEPIGQSAVGTKMLAAMIYPRSEGTTGTFAYSGIFADKEESNTPGAFDALNYEVSISTGQAKVTLIWNKDVVEIDPFFKTKLDNAGYQLPGSTATYEETINGNQVTLKFMMDQSKGAGDYLIPFYWVNRKADVTSSWDSLETIIQFEAEKVD